MRCPYVYILASKRNGTLYVGVTADLRARLTKVNAGGPGFCEEALLTTE